MSHVYSAEDGEPPSQHEWSGEPGLEVDRSGTIYVSGVCCVVAASPVWVSRDGGRTFAELATPAHVREWTIGAEGDLDVDNAGRVFFADTTVSTIQFTRWSARGRSWDFTAPAIGVVPGLDDRPWLVWTEPSLYLYVNHGAYVQIYGSPDGGHVWIPGEPLAWEGTPGGFFPGHLAADRRTGALWVAGQVPDSGGSEQIGSAVSTDGGRTHRQAVVFRTRQGEQLSPIFPGIATVDRAGNGYTTWSTWTKRGCQVYYAVSKDLGRSWSRPVRVSSGRGCATFPWIDASDRGELALAYYQTRSTGQQEVDPLTMLTEGQPAFQDNVPDDAKWSLRIAHVAAADTSHPIITDAHVPFRSPLFLGPLERQGWDYLGVDLGRDRIIRAVFSEKYRDSAPQTWFVASKPVG